MASYPPDRGHSSSSALSVVTGSVEESTDTLRLHDVLAAKAAVRAPVVVLAGCAEPHVELPDGLFVAVPPEADHVALAAAIAVVLDAELEPPARLGPSLALGRAAHASALAGRDPRLRAFEAVRSALGVFAAAHPSRALVFGDAQHASDDGVELFRFLARDAARAPGVLGIGRSAPRVALVFCVPPDPGPFADRLQLAPDALRIHRAPARLDLLARRPVLAARLGQLASSASDGLTALEVLLPRSVPELVDSAIARFGSALGELVLAADLVAAPLTAAALAAIAPQGGRFGVDRLRREGWLHESPAGLVLAPWAAGVASRVAMDASLRRRVATHLVAAFRTTRDPMPLRRAMGVDAPAALAQLGASTLAEAARELAGGAQYSVARECLEAALRSLGSDADRADLRVALADVELAAGRTREALDALKGLGDGPLLTALRLARVEAQLGQLEDARLRLEHLASRASHPTELARVSLELAELALRAGRPDEAAERAREALAAGGGLALEAENLLGKVAFWRADYPDAIAHYDRVIAAPEFEPDPGCTHPARLRAVAQHNRGLVALRLGRSLDAVRCLTEAAAQFEAHGDHLDGAVCLHNLGLAYELDQRYGLAGAVFERAIDLHERFGTPQSLLGAINSLADLQLRLGELWRARRLLDHVVNASSEASLAYVRNFACLRLAQLDRLEGQHSSACDEGARLAPLFQASGHVEDAREAYLLAAQSSPAGDARVDAWLRAAGALPDTETAALALIERARREPSLRVGVQQVDEAAARLERLGQRPSLVEALTLAVRRLVDAGRGPEAAPRAERGRALLAQLRDRILDANRQAFDALGWVVAAESAFAIAEAPAPSAAAVETAEPARHGLIGAGPALARVLSMVERLAPTQAPVLITGESGTGKELVATALAGLSRRASRPFVRVNAAAFADSLLESELFGHERGAFTGAVARKLGAFEQANGGTLFLDEIGDISPKTQVTLLRVLQSGELRRVGGTEVVRVDVRVISATHRDLDAMVQSGQFRLDLLYRLRGVEINVPALRERGRADLDALSAHVLSRLGDEHGCAATLEPAAAELLAGYSWPGNVRELENVLRSAYFFAQERLVRSVRQRVITAEDLRTYTTLRHAVAEPQSFTEVVSTLDPTLGSTGALPAGFDLNETKRLIEIRCIERALEQAGGNISHAAQLLGLKRPRLSQKIKEYGLKEPGSSGIDGE